VLALLREDLTNDQIAERLGVTVHAARYHVSEILSKLGVATREEAAAWQPEKVRAGPRWSIALQIWLAAAAAVALIAVGVLAWGVSRGSGDDDLAGVVTSRSPTSAPSTVDSQSPTPTFVPESRPGVGANVRAMQLVAGDTGIVQTDDALLCSPFIQNGEKIVIGPPVDITPPGVAPSDIRDFHFLDSDHGSLAQITIAFAGQFVDSNTVNIWRTSDGGQTWQSSPITDFLHDDIFPGAYFDFLDSQTGWVVLTLATNTAHSAGYLFKTEDGGATWTKLSIPSGRAVYFADANNGWTVGGPEHFQLYATHDGGQNWTEASDITPQSTPSGQRAFGPPVAINGGTQLLLPVTVAVQGETESLPGTFILYSSTDGGQSWQPVAQTSIGPYEVGNVAPAYIFASGAVVVFGADGSDYQLAPGATEFQSFTPTETGDVQNAFSQTGFFTPYSLDFLDQQHGWGLTRADGCEQFKSDCWQATFVEQTQDGGKTWSLLSFGSAPTPTP